MRKGLNININNENGTTMDDISEDLHNGSDRKFKPISPSVNEKGEMNVKMNDKWSPKLKLKRDFSILAEKRKQSQSKHICREYSGDKHAATSVELPIIKSAVPENALKSRKIGKFKAAKFRSRSQDARKNPEYNEHISTFSTKEKIIHNHESYLTSSLTQNSMPTPNISQTNANFRISTTSNINPRKNSTIRESKCKGKIYDLVDEIVENEAAKRDSGGLGSRPSLYSNQYKLINEEDKNRSQKITAEARDDIKKMQEVLGIMFEKLNSAPQHVSENKFGICDEVVALMKEFQSNYTILIDHLRYSPYKKDMLKFNKQLVELVNELEHEPPFVLIRLVEFGYYAYEIGRQIREDLLPKTFANMIYVIQIRLYRLKTGRVIRQIYFVPEDLDPVISTYFKSRRMLRIENFCNCCIVLLPPDDPRCLYCPPGYRTIEVNFDPHKGRYIGFAGLLNSTGDSKIPVKLAATIFKRLSGMEIDLAPEEQLYLNTSEVRVRCIALESDMETGNGRVRTHSIEGV